MFSADSSNLFMGTLSAVKLVLNALFSLQEWHIET